MSNVFNNLCNLRSRLDGINFVAAIRVILFDAPWNPSHDVFTKQTDSVLVDLALERKDWLLTFNEHDPLLDHKHYLIARHLDYLIVFCWLPPSRPNNRSVHSTRFRSSFSVFQNLVW